SCGGGGRRTAKGLSRGSPSAGAAGPAPSPSGGRRRVPPLLAEDRPPFVIAPASGDHEVARRAPPAPEAEALDQGQEEPAAGLDVGLEAVEPEAPEGVAEDEREALGHVALAGVGAAPVVAEVGALERAPHDLAHVDGADDRPVLPATDQDAHAVSPARAAEV